MALAAMLRPGIGGYLADVAGPRVDDADGHDLPVNHTRHTGDGRGEELVERMVAL